MIEKNSNGGICDNSKSAIERAKKADLISFPKNINGTNCFNCQWIGDKKDGIAFCHNKHIKQYVNGQMCCNLWDKDKTFRAWE
jgi:hypothetical protein